MKKKIIFAVAAFSAAAIFSAFCEEEQKDEAAVQEQVTETEAPNPESDFEIDFNEDITEVYITGYIGESNKIIIPETIQGLPVTKIVDFIADENNIVNYNRSFGITRAEKLFVPSSVKQIERIGGGHFILGQHTGNGTEVVLSEGLVSIEESAFSGAKITSMNFPSTLKNIKKEAFEDAIFNSAVSLPENVDIAESAFEGAEIVSISLPSTLKHIKKETFSSAEIKEGVVLPEGLVGIDEEAFRYAEISSVTFPSTLKYIKAAAFAETKVKEVNLKEGLEYIGPMAFCECNIESLTMPSSIKYFGLYYPLSHHTFDLASVSELNLPEDTTGWHFVLYGSSKGYDSKKGYESEVESESYSVSLFNIISSPADSQNVAVRRMQRKLENTSVQKADFKEFEDFYESYFGSNLKEIFYHGLISDK